MQSIPQQILHLTILLPLLAVFLFAYNGEEDQTANKGTETVESSGGETTPPPPKQVLNPQGIDLQGHRGCRGLLPENSIPAMERALELGMTTLELDVVITKDHQVLVSHEPFMSHEICLDPDGNPISEEDEKNHNIYQMDYATVQQYDCGSKVHPRFPDQEKLRVTKPLLSDLIDFAENWANTKGVPAPNYNIEIKREEGQDGLFHPGAEEFATLLIELIREKGVTERTYIQSFDIASLEASHGVAPDFKMVYLVWKNEDFRDAMSKLSFTPDVYSPDFNLVTPELILYAKEMGMKVIPWTVNEEDDMRDMIGMGVDGIISDYPDRLVRVVENR